MPGKREGKKRGRMIPLLVKFILEMVSGTKLLRDPLDPVKPTHAVPVSKLIAVIFLLLLC